MFNVQANINDALEDILMNSHDCEAVTNDIEYIKVQLLVHHLRLSSYKLAKALMDYTTALNLGFRRTLNRYLHVIRYYYNGYMVDRKYEPLVA